MNGPIYTTTKSLKMASETPEQGQIRSHSRDPNQNQGRNKEEDSNDEEKKDKKDMHEDQNVEDHCYSAQITEEGLPAIKFGSLSHVVVDYAESEIRGRMFSKDGWLVINEMGYYRCYTY